MILCKTCGLSFLPNTLFCSECGEALYQALAYRSVSRWTCVHFILQDGGRQQKLPLTEPIHIGRADPDNGYWPHLDLSEQGGAELGVSRRHAIIRATTDDPVIIDQGSMNGTWIDEVRLEPDRPYMLPLSGQIRFGNLSVRIFLE